MALKGEVLKDSEAVVDLSVKSKAIEKRVDDVGYVKKPFYKLASRSCNADRTR